MLNHARTLLLNTKPVESQRCSYPGEEFIDPAYTPFAWPTYLQSLYRDFYGANPDRWMKNYRTRQILSLVHSTPLEEYILKLDPRITYNFDTDPFVDPTLFVPFVSQETGTEADQLRVFGKSSSPDMSGRMYAAFVVDVLNDNAVSVQRTTKPFSNVVFDLELDAHGWSTALPLSGTGHTCKINTTNPGANWYIQTVTRPTRDLGQIAATIRHTGEPILTELFGLRHDEPYKTFKNLWWDCKETPLKLSGLILAMIYRAEERRLDRA